VQTIAIGDFVICKSVSLSSLCKTAEWIEVLFGVKTLGGPRNIVLDER